MSSVVTNRWVWFAYCVLLFCAGAVFGFVFNSGGKIGLVKFLGAAASLATIAAAITAIAALTLWKSQFKLQKKYEAVMDVRAYLFDATHPLIYLERLTRLFEEYLRTSDDGGLTKNYPSSEFQIWHAHAAAFGRSWDMMMVLLTDEEFETFNGSPKLINDMVGVAGDALAEIAFGSTGPVNRGERIVALRPKYNEYAAEVNRVYRELEEQSKVLLKLLTR